MPGDAEGHDPMLLAIAELRIDVNRLIDEQVARVKGRAGESTPPRPARLSPIAIPIAGPAPVLNDTAAPDEAAGGRTLDPRQRLDALAKHLDHRLRQGNGPSNERTGRPPPSQE